MFGSELSILLLSREIQSIYITHTKKNLNISSHNLVHLVELIIQLGKVPLDFGIQIYLCGFMYDCVKFDESIWPCNTFNSTTLVTANGIYILDNCLSEFSRKRDTTLDCLFLTWLSFLYVLLWYATQ